MAPVRESVAPGWFPQLSESSERAVGQKVIADAANPGDLSVSKLPLFSASFAVAVGHMRIGPAAHPSEIDPLF